MDVQTLFTEWYFMLLIYAEKSNTEKARERRRERDWDKTRFGIFVVPFNHFDRFVSRCSYIRFIFRTYFSVIIRFWWCSFSDVLLLFGFCTLLPIGIMVVFAIYRRFSMILCAMNTKLCYENGFFLFNPLSLSLASSLFAEFQPFQ